MPFDKPHAVSPGLWALAWKRLRSDGVAMVSLAIVALFLLQMVLSGTGLIAKDWAKEVGVTYAPPAFVGPEPSAPAPAGATGAPAAPTASDKPTELPIEDPLADALAAIRNPTAGSKSGAASETGTEGKTVDPL